MLTKIQIAALRKANRIVFSHREGDKDGDSVIRAIKENRPSEKDPFAQDVECEIPCSWSLTDYAEGDSRITYTAQKAGQFRAFEMIHVAQYEECWKTIASLLREGDALTLLWKRNAWNTGNLTDVNLHGDGLDLQIDRGKTRLTFHIRMSVCPDNTARMIRVPYSSTRAAEPRTEEAA
jgi:hypothetical protein